MQDIAIVPLLVRVTLLSPSDADMGTLNVVLSVGEALLAVAAVEDRGSVRQDGV